MRKTIIYSFIALSVVLTGCEKDNFDEPAAILEGQITYDGAPVSVRSNSAELELWQDGYALNEFIPVYIAQDGSYSVSLFDGEYKLVRKGGDPWQPQLTDTIVINVSGRTELDVPVTPYITLTDASYAVSGGSLSADFQINQVVAGSELQEVFVFMSNSVLLDRNINDYAEALPVEAFSFGSPASVSVSIPEDLQNAEYVFVRIGARSSNSNELIYTQAEKIEL